MFLKRLLLHGFKSFADRTVFEFGPGMTAIVGPNGCGKSNVLDGVRWVLGEQSAKTLRGKKMLDVVFSGSRTRKPSNFAEIQLTFDNSTGFLPCDEIEVTVGRLLYSNGESEYRLNGNACRLKDIRDLLLDTGVGVDAYSVIEQGRVDLMLHANPLERRVLFEEAAGISRYQVRRAEAERKLDRTQNNLLRLTDVLEELERRLRSIKLAAGKARRFQEHDQRLRELRSTYALAEYHELEQGRRERESRVRSLDDVLGAKRSALASRDADAAELEHERQKLDERIQATEADARRTQAEAGALRERIRQNEHRKQEQGAVRARQAELAQETERRLDEQEQRAAQAERDLHALEQRERQEQAQIESLTQQHAEVQSEAAGAQEELERQKKQAFEGARRATILQNECMNLEQQCERLDAQRTSMQARRAELQSEEDALETRRAELETRVLELDQAAGAVAERAREIEIRQCERETERDRLMQEVGEIKERRSGVLSRLTVLEDLERRLEGVEQCTRTVLAWREGPDGFGGLVGLVADLLRIDDPRVHVLHAILARFEKNVVVRESHAFLAECDRRDPLAGQVGVLALDRLAPDASAQRYQDAPGVLARAVDWVRCEPQFRPLAEQLLGKIIIVKEMERALALADAAPAGFVFVTTDGRMVESGGRMTVGSPKASSGLISRKTEIRQLRQELDEVETELERTHRALAEMEQQISDARVRQESVLNELAALQKQHADAQTELVRLNDEAGRLGREQRSVSSQAEELSQSLHRLRQRSIEARTEHEAAETGCRHDEQRVVEVERRVRELEATATTTAQRQADARVEAGRTAERRLARGRSLEELRAQCASLGEQRVEHERGAADAVQRLAELDRDLADSTQRAAMLAEAHERTEANALALREQRQSLLRRIESCGATVRGLHAEIEEIDAALRECEVELREFDVRKENLTTRIHDDLSLDLEQLYVGYEHAEQDWEAIKAEIEALRQKIARLGNVNLDALAELEELSPRHEHLVVQRDDLHESIARLEKLIRELDEESRARFTACFEQVRANFQELFRKLFGGGKADIILEDPENPLSCGIEIIARPPGKEPQVLSLLSGGEKTLAAVALLFAVFKRKPSPFAILDEVDAALDESNIDRFNNLLHEFLEDSQFVVITHNKRTMQCADILYGVTMEDLGVSKRVSVRFDQSVEAPVLA